MTSARKRARTGGGEEDEGPAPVADGFEAPIFGVRVVGKVSTLALEGEDGPLSLGTAGVASDHAGAWYVATKDSLLHVSPARRVRRVAALPSDEYYTVDASPDGSAAFVADYSGNKIRRVQVATGEVTTIAGSSEDGDADGVGDAAQFCGPAGIALSSDGSALFVADYENHMIRRVEVATGAVTTLAGGGDEDNADGVDEAAEFNNPAGIAVSFGKPGPPGQLCTRQEGLHLRDPFSAAAAAATTAATASTTATAATSPPPSAPRPPPAVSPSSSAFGPASGAALPACSTAASERKRMMSRS